ncbi:MAG: hypothetical protein CVU05_06845 [Bacteroidetes bacterium HGW-Bacteroidetes-21]|nr:MAG: hypothetical protein CVU05_06845 [Bacteroidetes bacterium HGW-Bacteroidetes-21]
MAISQPIDDMSGLGSNHLKGFTKSSLRLGDTYSAIDFLNEYLIRNPENIKSTYELAELYRGTRDYGNAALWYKKVIDADEDNYPLARFYYAKMLKMEGVYDEAMINFSDFKKNIKQLMDEALFKKILKNEIDGIDYARKALEPKQRIQVYHLDATVNNKHIDLSPLALDDNTMIYASLYMDTLKYYSQKDSTIDVPVRQFYYAKRSGDSWKGTGLAEVSFNIPGINTGNGALSTDGMRFYFTRCEKNWKNENICKIFVSRKEGSEWTVPEEVTELNHPQFTTTQPAIGTDSRSGNEVIYFSSNRPGGKGGLDLWYAIFNKKTGTFKEPKNMGSIINSLGDEMTPWYDTQTRNLYFSSDGHPSMGGLDIFKSTGEMRTWEEPENVGLPINSCADELYFSYTPSHEDGFFVSNRIGGFAHRCSTCGDDIYFFRLLDFIKIGVTGKVLAIQDSSIYKILEQNIDKNKTVGEYDDTDELIEPAVGAIINLFWQNEKSKTDMFIARDTVKADGSYFFRLEPEKKYKLLVENYGFFNKTLTTNTMGIVSSDTIHLDAIYINKIPLEPLVVKNIYYEFNKSDLTKESEGVIDSTIFRIMTENPTIVVELRSHTDSISSAGYNLKLSQRRAESVVKYLIAKGIKEERLIAKGFGKNMPIAPNSNPDGSDNPEGRQKNRRTEFRIVGSLEQYSDIKYEE